MVALPDRQLWWLGLDPKRVTNELHRRGIQSGTYGLDVKPSAAATREWRASWNDALKYAVAIECEAVGPRVLEENPSVVAAWRAKIMQTAGAIEKALDDMAPDLVVLVQGYEPANAIARSWALSNGCRLLALENTALKNRMLWDDVSGITTNRSLAANYFWRYESLITASEEERFRQTVLGSVRSFKSGEHAGPHAPVAKPIDQPYVLFLGQVYTDSSVVFGLAEWSEPIQIISKLAEWCSQRGYRLVIKLHPKEAQGKDPVLGRPYHQLTFRKIRETPGLMERLALHGVVIDSENSLDTYDLIEKSAFAVTINSQAGLEAAMIGKAVVVCGRCFYGGLGFTLDAPSPSLLPVRLEQAVEGVDANAAVQFGLIFYEKYCVEKSEDGLIRLVEARMGPKL